MAFGSLSIKGRALRYLSQREHSRQELERKLRRHVQNEARRRQRDGGGPAAESGADVDADGDGDGDGASHGDANANADAVSRAGALDVDKALREIAPALDELAAAGLLSDERAAASVLHSQGARYGVRRLKQTLQQRGHEPELVTATLQQARITELARAQQVWRRRYGTPPADAAERARQVRFLMGRGFEGDVIRRVIQGGDDGLPDEG